MKNKGNPLARANKALKEVNKILEAEGMQLLVEHTIKIVPKRRKE